MELTVFEFRHNPDTYESAAYTVSIHRTRKGAEIAMEFHKNEEQKQLDEIYKDDLEDKPTIDEYQWWGVQETKLLD